MDFGSQILIKKNLFHICLESKLEFIIAACFMEAL